MRISDRRQEYLESTFGLDVPLLADIRKQMLEHHCEGMSISSFEARLLQFFIRRFNIRTVVEVGTLFGYSSIAMAMALPEGGQVHTIEKSEQNYKFAVGNVERSGVTSKITLHPGDANAVLPDLSARGPFDMVFIDGNKKDYGVYLTWAEKNVRAGGLIVGDNTFLFGAVHGEGDPSIAPETIEVLKDFNRRLADPTKYDSILMPTSEGMTIAWKKS